MKDTKTKHPSLRGVNRVIKNLESVLPEAKLVEKNSYSGDSVNMVAIGVHNTCNTPMCHGGWYALAVNRKEKRHIVNYKTGADLIAQELGFKNRTELMDWAEVNPKVWGNTSGYNMFCSMFAFGNGDKHNLSVIVRHWKKVATRLRNLKAKK